MKFCVRFPKGFMIPWIFFFREWPGCAKPLPQTLAFVRELKERGIPVYLLSNAPTYFADYMKVTRFLKPFDGTCSLLRSTWQNRMRKFTNISSANLI